MLQDIRDLVAVAQKRVLAFLSEVRNIFHKLPFLHALPFVLTYTVPRALSRSLTRDDILLKTEISQVTVVSTVMISNTSGGNWPY